MQPTLFSLTIENKKAKTHAHIEANIPSHEFTFYGLSQVKATSI